MEVIKPASLRDELEQIGEWLSTTYSRRPKDGWPSFRGRRSPDARAAIVPPVAPPPTPLPRLHVLLRPGAPNAVVLRRGPTKVFCSIGWDLASDTFSVGQWCKHTIHSRCCDLSPDGKWMLYSALDARKSREIRGTFTAISRAPYLKALWLRSDGWFGKNFSYTAADTPLGRELLESIFGDEESSRVLTPWYRGRVVRDGWSQSKKHGLIKPIGAGWLLRKIVTNAKESHQLLGPDGAAIALPRWEWAEHDAPRERVVWAEGGMIRCASVGPGGLVEPRVLFDACPMRFESIKAPYDGETVLSP